MNKKVLIPLFNDYVAPRFDLATEVLIIEAGREEEEKIVMLPNASAEQLCHMILTEQIEVLICGGIEEEYYQYLKWKKIDVQDSVVGTWKSALDAYAQNTAQNGKQHPPLRDNDEDK